MGRRYNIVGIAVERSIEMITCILAIMKAGGAYLPIDPEYPQERIDFMLQDSHAAFVLTGHELTGSIRLDAVPIMPAVPKNTDLLYIIYTSGSTGKPKGVMLEHRNLVNLFKFQAKYTNLDYSRILQFTTISFDVSAQEIFSALLSGGQLYLVKKQTRADIPELFKLIERNRIKTVFLPVSFLKAIFKEEEYLKCIPRCIDHIVTAGEQLVIGNNFRKYLKERKVYLHNHYGPSESHVVTTLTIEPGGEIKELPAIGKPVLNTGIYIVDKFGKLSPPGVAGEIRIGGIQVGRGYLNRPELTAEKFSRDYMSYMSYTSNKSYILYKTGDLGRFLADGNIEFLGRIDQQVKIRGFRVELGEIENRLANYPGIKEAVVLAHEDRGDKYLCAYIVSEKNWLYRHYENPCRRNCRIICGRLIS